MSAERHNAAIRPILQMIMEAEPTEIGQWILLETLCLGIGRFHHRSNRDIAEFVDTIADRLTTGERQ